MLEFAYLILFFWFLNSEMCEVMVVFLYILSISQLILIKVSQAKYEGEASTTTKVMILGSGGIRIKIMSWSLVFKQDYTDQQRLVEFFPKTRSCVELRNSRTVDAPEIESGYYNIGTSGWTIPCCTCRLSWRILYCKVRGDQFGGHYL